MYHVLLAIGAFGASPAALDVMVVAQHISLFVCGALSRCLDLLVGV
jgi:hypothetical protein